MKEPGKPRFTVGDIERYFGGTMSPEERHALEKAALDDPFLADAMEGFALTRTPVHDVAELKERLEKRIRPEKRKSLLASMPSWTKVAAVVLILLGGGWLILTTSLNRSRPVATVIQDTSAKSITNKEGKSENPGKGEQRVLQDTQSVQATANTEKLRSTAVKNSRHSNPVRTDSNSLAGVNENSTAFAEKQLADSGINNAASSSHSLVASPPVTAKVAVGETYAPARVAKTEDALNNQKAGMAKEKSTVLYETAAKKQAPRLFKRIVADSMQNLAPAGGWSRFDDYVDTQLKSINSLHQQQTANYILLRFEINEAGKPVNIIIEKSNCATCNQEAIRLLQNGPNWEGTGKQAWITIRF